MVEVLGAEILGRHDDPSLRPVPLRPARQRNWYVSPYLSYWREGSCWDGGWGIRDAEIE